MTDYPVSFSVPYLAFARKGARLPQSIISAQIAGGPTWAFGL
jgi:hypothetical protein